MRKIISRILVDGHAEHPEPGLARLADRHPRILDPEPAFVVIDIIRLAVGQKKQQTMPLRTLDELARDMPDGGTIRVYCPGFNAEILRTMR